MTQEQYLKNLMPPSHRADVILDTDAYNEVDDQFAIAYLLRSEKLNPVGICAAPFLNEKSSSAEDGMQKSHAEILKLLKLMNREEVALRVYRGSDRFMRDETDAVDSPAARFIAASAAQYSAEHPLYVVAIGAITNVAAAVLLAPEAMRENTVIVWLGGSGLEMPRNREFNLSQDIACARVVMGSGAPLVILPCAGVVSTFTTTEPEMRYWLSGKNELCDYLVDNTVNEANAYAKGKVWSRVIWDVCTIGWLLNDGNAFMHDKLINTPIPEYDDVWAMQPDRPLCKYVYVINRDALMGDLFEKLSR